MPAAGELVRTAPTLSAGPPGQDPTGPEEPDEGPPTQSDVDALRKVNRDLLDYPRENKPGVYLDVLYDQEPASGSDSDPEGRPPAGDQPPGG